MKLLMIAATHGNELLGIKLYQRLLQKHSPLLEHIDFIVGNPKAYALGKRYIDCDLNRSYGVDGSQYEQRRAREIIEYAQLTKPDLILDMHTTSCHQPNCLIVRNLSGAMKRRFLAASHIDAVLQVEPMNDIGTIGDNVVGYEIPNRAISAKILDDIVQDLQRFIEGSAPHTHKTLFKMRGKIYKADTTSDQVKSFINFQMHELGYVPIMTGNNSYKKQTNYLGFKSSAPEKITIQ
ncbi:MAG: succinylglutamate desuccinylase/aspartoacylase family protein [Candidatus Saccharibacteria bacterium]|nr:succinylglutamate desuccinylase/aspartoacylase family protein [Candidatus Saccharibacteria bacterium]